MRELDRRTPELLDRLYEGATDPSCWASFLERLAAVFGAATATLRVTDLAEPSVQASYTFGFDRIADRRYHEAGVATDPFHPAMAAGPLGLIHASHEIVPDRDFSGSAHYEHFFRPNGNFYAMGGHFERDARATMHIGVHRPEGSGPFRREERRALAFFVPHLRRAARVTGRLGEFQSALQHARAALDSLPFGVWILDRQLRCRWANAPAEDTMRTTALGLRHDGGRLAIEDTGRDGLLRSAVERITRGRHPVQTVPLGVEGAALVLVGLPEQRRASTLAGAADDAVLAFLFDPARPTPLDVDRVVELYHLTPAEVRLLGVFMRGLDLHEAAARLGISIHTARAQMKSCLQKTDTRRQSELMRKLLLGATRIDGHGD